jgi:DNA gyrase subunit B
MSKNECKITVLEGPEAVRETSGMYIGNTEDGTGLHHLLMEVLDNSVDEYLADHCSKIVVTLYKDGSASVSDNGRGIPTYFMPEQNMSALEVVFCVLHAGGKFSNNNNYKISGGLHGVGVSVTNALSARLKVVVTRDGKEYSMAFEKGKKVEDLSERPIRSKETGTFIRFGPDLTIFKRITKFDSQTVERRLLEISYLCRGLEIEFVDERTNTKKIFGGDNDISGFIKYLGNGKLLDKPIIFTDKNTNIVVDVGLQWFGDGSDTEISKYYTNNIPNLDGGSHMVGFKTALTKTINSYINDADIPKSLKISLSGDDIREGLVSVVSIRHPDPKFSSQTKDKLVSEDARTAVENVVSSFMLSYLEQNPVIAKKIVTQCVNAYKAREAAKKAREATRKTVLKDGGGVLPGKLADCSSKDPEECELYIVEGSSAGGSAKQGRNREFQAVLPLRGKVLNVERCEFQKMMANEELTNLITAIGAGIGKGLDPEAIRYNKIILMCDSDVDGSHIRTLLLTFFFRQMPQLIRNGNIYIGQPPLYRVEWRKNSYYLKDEHALSMFYREKKISQGDIKLQRFKGLGEMNPEQLWNTTMNPDTRTLLKVVIEDYVEADRIFSILMGSQVEPRKQMIFERALNVSHLDT